MKTALDSGLQGVYPAHVAEKKATEFDSSTRQRRTTAAKRYFFVRTMLSPLWAAVVGRPRPAGYLCRRSVNPAICRPPRLTAGRGVKTDKGGIMPSARSSVRNSISPPASGLKYTGANNLGLGFPDDECYFMVWENRDLRDWSVFEALARLDEFSERERNAILRTCEIHAMLQARYGEG